MAALVDTNVVLDALADRGEWARDAQNLLFLASQGLQVVNILLDSLSVVEVGFGEYLLAANSKVVDYEDAVVAEAARRAKLDYIVTRNEKDFAGSEVPSISPRAYLESVLVPE